MKGLGAIAPAIEGLGELIHLDPGPAEDDGGSRGLDVENASQRRRFVGPSDDVSGLTDQGGEVGARGSLFDEDARRLAEVAPSDLVDSGRQGGREQNRLAFFGSGFEDFLDVVGEPHVEHLVGLVEHHQFNVAKSESAPPDVIEGAARGCNNDVHSAAQGMELAADRLAAVDRYHPGAEVAPIAIEGLRNLDGQFPGRDQNQRCGSVGPVLRAILCRAGRAKAAVLPVPVAACPNKSLPARRIGIACDWIGVGSS